MKVGRYEDSGRNFCDMGSYSCSHDLIGDRDPSPALAAFT